MLFDQVTNEQMRAASIFTGATMAAFVAAPIFRTRARTVRMMITGVYIAGVIAFIASVLS